MLNERNILQCPKCKEEKITVLCLLSFPPQFKAECNCGFQLTCSDREDSFSYITQEELDKFKGGENA